MGAVQANLRAVRDVFAVTQKQVGELVRLSPQAISAWERGRVSPDIVQLEAIAKHFGFPAELFLVPGGVRDGIDPVTLKTRLGSGKASVRAATYTAPLYDASSASFALGEATVLGQVPVPEEVLSAHPDGFFLMVQGDRVNRVMAAGCYALVDPEAAVENNDLAAVVVGTEPAQVVRFHRLSNSVVLSPDSTDESFRDEIHDTTTGIDVRVLGRVVWFGAPFGARL